MNQKEKKDMKVKKMEKQKPRSKFGDQSKDSEYYEAQIFTAKKCRTELQITLSWIVLKVSKLT